MRCLCCNEEISPEDKDAIKIQWHKKCIKKFFGMETLPELEIDEKVLEELANSAVSKGLTVPGVQKKLSVHLSKDKGNARLTIIDYPTGYILKPQSSEYRSLPETEFMVMKMATLAGIKVVPNALMKYSDGYIYITKRIDRSKKGLLAMEDFCQLSGRMTSDKYRSSYENCGKVIKKYAQNVGLDLAELYYRLLFCFITCNSDMHLKNFSLIETAPGSRIYGLSPAYDLLPVNMILPEDLDQMALSLNGKKRNIRKKDFLTLAQNLGIPDKTAISLMEKAANLQDMIMEQVDLSYLSDDMKHGMKKLVEDRIKTITA
ncbi:MAG: HipA domain-containing protein [Butyrivibrio sp.]|nr:HipA domain-containing protein [Butyrivibrio sp.]